MLAKVGIKLKPKLIEATVLTEVLMKGEHQGLIASSLTGPDSLATLRCYYSKTPRTACNYTGFNNPDFDKLLDDASQTGDMDKRTDLLKKANAILFDEAPVWFFNYNKAVLAHQPWVHGLQANPTEITHQYPEDVWIDASVAREVTAKPSFRAKRSVAEGSVPRWTDERSLRCASLREAPVGMTT